MSNTNPSTPGLLSALSSSLTSSLSSLPAPSAVQPPSASFSLLSTKNELFLTYVQNLTFLIILNLRNFSSAHSEEGISSGKGRGDKPERERQSDRQTSGSNAPTAAKNDKDKETEKGNSSESDLRDAVVENLVGLRVYLEKGVRPLENRLKYQLDKLLLAAADHAREKSAKHDQSNSSRNNQTAENEDEDEVEAEAEDEEQPNTLQQASSIPPLAHRPNPSALIRPSTNHATTHPKTTTTSTTKPTAPYRPPRINPTLPPTNSKSTSNRTPRRSRAVDAFIREEMGDAPIAELSIGAGLGLGLGRRARGAAIAEEEYGTRSANLAHERKEWEETRLVRLPDDTQQSKSNKRKRTTGGTEDIMAGIDWGLMNAGDDNENRDRGERKRYKKTKVKAKSKAKGRGKGRK